MSDQKLAQFEKLLQMLPQSLHKEFVESQVKAARKEEKILPRPTLEEANKIITQYSHKNDEFEEQDSSFSSKHTPDEQELKIRKRKSKR